jgi:lactate dehydrogenase-like 2-hydroxyacid dehydrogenase
MKLLDNMKDEELGLALLYNFTKGYDKPVPMELYDIVLPLLYIDEIMENITKYDTLKECIEESINSNKSIQETFLNNLKNYEEMTSNALAIAMIQQHLIFKFVDNTMCGVINESKILDLNEALILGKMMQSLTKKDVIEYFDHKIMNIVVLQTDSLGTDMDLSEFYKLGNVTMYPECKDEEVVERIKDADIVVTNKNTLFEEQLAGLSQLKLICLTATGYNNVDIDYCSKHNIKVANVKGYSTDTVAQHTISLALSLIEKNTLYDEYVKSKEYSKNGVFSFFDYHFHDVSSMTWGIVGLGDIGKKVAKIAEALGAKVQYYSTSGLNHNDEYQSVDFDTLLETSDIISIHAPLNEKTKYLFNFDTMSKMKKHSYLINVGRGPIIKEKDLVDLINLGRFDGVGLDVFENEPLLEDSPIYRIKHKEKVILTPHVAWGSVESRTRLIHEVYLNIKEFMNGNERNIINK